MGEVSHEPECMVMDWNCLILPYLDINVEHTIINHVKGAGIGRPGYPNSYAHPQEHLTVLRTMVVTFPARFPELAALADAEEEIDFFNNIAHIQMHRRSRALARLSRVSDQSPPIVTVPQPSSTFETIIASNGLVSTARMSVLLNANRTVACC